MDPSNALIELGYRRAKAEVRGEVAAMVDRLRDELIKLADEIRAARADFRRLRGIEQAIDTERDPNALLH